MILLDTSFLYALNDASDRNHRAVVALLDTLNAPLALPTPVLPELCYLLHSRLGHHVMRRFLHGLIESDIHILPLSADDMQRIVELLEQYTDARLDFTDAGIVALAERHGISTIATFDHRDFSIVRPRHTVSFELLP